jgi:DNA-binding transcriptional LysR family regulator
MESAWTLDQLRTLIEVVRTGSFTKAAEALSLSQPAVSVQMRSLERSLGVPLLERRPRHVVPTDAGRIVHRYALRMARLEAESRAEIADLKKLAGGTLRVGAGATPSIFTLAPVFAEYYRRWPAVELRVQIGRTADLARAVLSDTLDLAIVSSDVTERALVRRPLYTETCVAIAGRSHPLAEHPEMDASLLTGHPLVLLPADSGFRRFLESALASRSVRLNTAMELASLEAIKEVVRTGPLMSVIPETAASGESEETGLRVIRLTGAELTRQTAAIKRPDRYVSAAMGAFYRLLGERWPEASPPEESAGSGATEEQDVQV